MAAGKLFAPSIEASVDPPAPEDGGAAAAARDRQTDDRARAWRGGGARLSLALACDLRIADESAQFVTAFAKVGASGDYGGSWFLARLVGEAKAKELYFTPPRVGANAGARARHRQPRRRGGRTDAEVSRSRRSSPPGRRSPSAT